jgi:hypothetical protein
MSPFKATAIIALMLTAPAARAEMPVGAAPLSPGPLAGLARLDAAFKLPNLPSVTLGGEQLWTDELVDRGWRIQQNVLSGHYRLLDPSDYRRAWGSYDQCLAAFDKVKKEKSLAPLPRTVVVTLHGLGRSRDHMAQLDQFLEAQGLTCIDVGYASTRRSLDEHAASLARVMSNLTGPDEIYFVCHSLGNLVVRRYLAEATAAEPRWQPDPRIKRMVMLGPPNNGAQLAEVIAELLNDNRVAAYVAGPSAMQLARQWAEAQKLLATPAFPFGIIAGGCGDGRGLNPLVHGDDDLIVAVEETKLPGASDFRVVPCRHGLMMDDPAVHKFVLSFLLHGYFTSDQERQPIAE